MLTNILMFFLGVLLAPVVRPLARPLLLELVRAGMQISEEMKRLSVQVKEDIEDATAEAEAVKAAKARVQAEKAASAPSAPPADGDTGSKSDGAVA